MNRTDALKAAEDFVGRQTSTPDSRYATKPTLEQRTAEVLRVAAWLLEGPEEPINAAASETKRRAFQDSDGDTWRENDKHTFDAYSGSSTTTRLGGESGDGYYVRYSNRTLDDIGSSWGPLTEVTDAA